MDISFYSLGWLLLALTFIFFILFKWIKGDSKALTAKYQTERNFCLPAENKREIIQKALENSRFKDIHFDEDSFIFYAKTKVSMSSWSELIEVKLIESKDETRISFLSVCFLFTQIFSWGKNRRNARRFFSELDRLIP